MTTFDIQSLDWTERRLVNTKLGVRYLRTAKPTEAFWRAWRVSKAELKAAGYSVSKDQETGLWTVCEWTDPKALDSEASRATDTDLEVPSPEGLEYLPYQRAGIAYAMEHPGCLIGDEMGLGKTIQAIGLANLTAARSILIICPASLRLNWQREIEKWSTRNLSIHIVKGGKPESWEEADVVIINWDVLDQHSERLHERTWDLAVMDEAHYGKNPKAKRSMAAWAIKAKRKLLLTGTPIPNRPKELWPLVKYLDPENLGSSWTRFHKSFCNLRHTRFGTDYSGSANLAELQAVLRERIMVRRLKKDVLRELPAKRRQLIPIERTPRMDVIVKEMERVVEESEEARTRVAALREELGGLTDEAAKLEVESEILRLQDVTSVDFERMSSLRAELGVEKIPAIIAHLKDCLEAGPVVCFVHHREVYEAIRKAFDSVGISGGDSLKDRQNAVDDFMAGNSKLFVGSIKAANTGITLTASSHVVIAEGDWVPGDVTQAEDRCHRIGQEDSVLVQYLVVDESIDARIAKTCISKQAVIDRALDERPKVEARQKLPERKTSFAAEDKVADPLEAFEPVVIRSMRLLASMCDGARLEDNCGFNKYDTRFGKSLANQTDLSPKQIEAGLALMRKYQRQLPQEWLEEAELS